MTTATVDKTELRKLPSDIDTNISKLNTVVSVDSDAAKNQSVNSNYYYSSGSFNFILDKGFKPETLEKIVITSVPFLPNWHKGIVSIHGLIIPVIDILAFVEHQGIETVKASFNKTYLLKLEHKNHSPIVFILDSLPRLVNIDNFKKEETNNNSPKWIKNYLKNDSTSLAFIDHKEMFKQMIKEQ